MNPYKRWLGIASGTTTPDYFELLGVDRDENNPEVITAAARSRLKILQEFRHGRYADGCGKIIERVHRAHRVLNDPRKRKKYMARLIESEQRKSERTSKLPPQSIAAIKKPTAQANPDRGQFQMTAIQKFENQKIAPPENEQQHFRKIAQISVGSLVLLILIGAVAVYVFDQLTGDTAAVHSTQQYNSPDSDQLYDPGKESKL